MIYTYDGSNTAYGQYTIIEKKKEKQERERGKSKTRKNRGTLAILYNQVNLFIIFYLEHGKTMRKYIHSMHISSNEQIPLI